MQFALISAYQNYKKNLIGKKIQLLVLPTQVQIPFSLLIILHFSISKSARSSIYLKKKKKEKKSGNKLPNWYIIVGTKCLMGKSVGEGFGVIRQHPFMIFIN